MESKRSLNLDVPSAISQLEYSMKEFDIKNKIYKIFFRGKSFEFEGFRTYSTEDDVTSIDWKASIRGDKLLVKQYKEEEEKKVFFVIDVSEQMVFGSSDKLKCEFAAEVSLSLAHLIIGLGHRVGFILYSDGVKYVSVPKRGKRNFSLFIDKLSDARSYGGTSDINSVLDFLYKNLDTSVSAIFLVSDFLRFNEETKKHMQLLSSKFETIALMIRDPIDKNLPDIAGEFIIQDPKTGEQIVVEPRLAKKSYERNVMLKERFIANVLKNSKIDSVELMTNESFVPPLSFFMKRRLKPSIHS